MLSPGLLILWIYLGVTYLLPWLYNQVFDLGSLSGYNIYPTHTWALLFTLCLSFILLMFDDKTRVARPSSVENQTQHEFSEKFIKARFLVSIFLLLLSLAGMLAGLNDFRYSEESAFAGGLSLVYIVAIIPPLLKFDLLVQLFYFSGVAPKQRSIHLLTQWLLAASLILSINGTATALFAFAYLFYSIRPTLFRHLVSVAQSPKHVMRNFLVLGCLFLFTIALGWVLGETAKRGGASEGVSESLMEPEFLTWAFSWALERVSSSYYSLLMAIHDHLLATDFRQNSNLLIPIKTFLYRIDVFLGHPFLAEKPITSAIARLNYELLTIVVNEREGTSPGLISSFLLCLSFPFNILLLSLYSLGLMRFFNFLVAKMSIVPNLFGLMLIAWISLVFFESPIDLLLILDEGNLLFILFAGFGIYLKSKEAQNSLAYQNSYA